MNYLVLYDQRGQCQRVATPDDNELQAFLDAGFQVVSQEEYNRCAALVPKANIEDLSQLTVAARLLQQLGNQLKRPAPPVNTQALDRLQSRQREQLRGITQNYLDKKINQEQWFRQMTDKVNQGNVASSALAVGGIDNLTQQEIQRIERDNEIQSQYLVKFRRELDAQSEAQALNRSQLYAGAMTPRYWTAHTASMGLTLPAMPGVRTSCGSNCKCNWDIRQLPGNGNWDCYWRLSAVEHCDECRQRQRVFSPLKIRNGILQAFNPGGIYK